MLTKLKNRIKKYLWGKDNYDARLTKKPEFDIYIAPPGIRHPEIAPSLPLIKYVHDNSPALKIATLKLRESIFRRGFEWTPKFKAKCVNCGKEFEVEAERCDECGALTRPPDESEVRRAEDFFRKVNVNKQHLIHLLKQVEDDINIFDDGYVVGIKEYWQDQEGNVIFESLKEIVRGNPITMRIVANENGELGGKWWTCLHHRDIILEEPKTCPKCGRKTFEVYYVSVEGGGSSPSAYYIDGEVIHVSKYSPSALYGYSPIVTLWEYALTLIHMIRYVYDSYTEQRLPRGVLAIKTSNPDSVFRFWRDVEDKLRKEPHYIPKLIVEGEGQGTGMEFVRFMDTLEEMEYIPVRDEIRRTIAAMYGVTNIFIGDMAGVGGLNAESEQIQITNMAAESAMKVYNDVILPEILRWLHVNDWKYELLSPFEESRQRELNEKLTETQIAQTMLGMGFDVELDEEGHFKFSGKAKKPQEEIPLQMSDESVGLKKYAGERDVFRERKEFQQRLNKIFEKEIQKILKSTKKLSSKELKKLVREAVKEAVRKMKIATDSHLKDIYIAGAKYAEKILGKPVEFTKIDEEALKAITDSDVLWDAYSNMSKALSRKLNNIITEAYKKPEEFSMSAMVNKMKEEADIETYRLERIVRTETQAASMKGREMAFRKFDPEGKFRYKWAVRHDDRTSEICKEIEREVEREGRGKGVPLDTLKEIIKRVSKKYMGKNWVVRDFVPHPNCRSGIVRVF